MPENKRLSRRTVLSGLIGLGFAGAAFRYWPEDGFVNPCLPDLLPESLLRDEWVEAAWAGIDPFRFWDSHVHLIGTGDSGSGMWVNPNMQSLRFPVQWAQRAFYLNASCTPDGDRSDDIYFERLSALIGQFPVGAKAMLLAFDYFHDEQGERVPAASAFFTPNDHAARLALEHPERFEWIASIHPYRHDAVSELREAVRKGAKAVKWLPPAQGMDPASPQCDPFYEAAVELNIPLLVHAGAELAVHGGNTEDFGNPLRLRRPLDHGVRVIVAHGASLGKGPDLDAGEEGARLSSFELFARMMDEPAYRDLLSADISAVTQINRYGTALKTLLARKDWHPRLLNGSDYPLPGILPLFSLRQLERGGFINREQSNLLSAIRSHNPMIFDFVLKRTLNIDGNTFGVEPFHTRDFFTHADSRVETLLEET